MRYLGLGGGINSEVVGKHIASIAILPTDLPSRGGADTLVVTFVDYTKELRISDEGQSCCEHRYMSTDDDFGYFVGAKLLDVSLENGPTSGDIHGDAIHEEQFLYVKTSKGSFTIVNHNENNGYYCGFSLAAAIVPREEC